MEKKTHKLESTEHPISKSSGVKFHFNTSASYNIKNFSQVVKIYGRIKYMENSTILRKKIKISV